jgi:hypothetical protein
MIRDQYIGYLEKQYMPYLQTIIRGVPFQPIVLRGGKNKPATTPELHEAIRQFQQNEKTPQRKGWSITWQEWTSKKFGKQQWPSAISVTTEEDFLYLIRKESETRAFKDQLQQLLQWQPAIRDWLARKPQMVLELRPSWPGICAVVDYLLNNEVAGSYLRSIPVPVHTKFIEQHKKTIYSILVHLNPGRFPDKELPLEDALQIQKKPFFFIARWLDKAFSEQFTAGMDIFAVPPSYLQQQHWHPERILLVENETNLYLLPPVPRTLAICSFGKALHLLKSIPFFRHTQLYYWGDMDEAGFAMLQDIRQYFGHACSLFMDEDTLLHHRSEVETKTNRYKGKDLPLLHPHEKKAYEMLLQHNWWLEQEKLQQSFVQETLTRVLE